MSRLSKLKILFFFEIFVLFSQCYGLIYIKNDVVLNNFFLFALCGMIATIGATVITYLNIKWGNEDLKLNN